MVGDEDRGEVEQRSYEGCGTAECGKATGQAGDDTVAAIEDALSTLVKSWQRCSGGSPVPASRNQFSWVLEGSSASVGSDQERSGQRQPSPSQSEVSMLQRRRRGAQGKSGSIAHLVRQNAAHNGRMIWAALPVLSSGSVLAEASPACGWSGGAMSDALEEEKAGGKEWLLLA